MNKAANKFVSKYAEVFGRYFSKTEVFLRKEGGCGETIYFFVFIMLMFLLPKLLSAGKTGNAALLYYADLI